MTLSSDIFVQALHMKRVVKKLYPILRNKEKGKKNVLSISWRQYFSVSPKNYLS